MCKRFLVFISSCLVGLSLAFPVLAARFYFDPAQQNLSIDQSFEAKVRFDAGRQEINALQGRVVFPTDTFVLEDIRDGNSIITFWVDRPEQTAVNASSSVGGISFSGIIPGGYQDHDGLIFTLRFRAQKKTTGKIDIQDARALLHDGLGTEAALEVTPLSYEVFPAGTVPPPVIPVLHDTDPPEPFIPTIVRDPSLFDGKWSLIFAAQDKGTGIDHYEVKEAGYGERGSFQSAASPYLLHDQWLMSRIYVKAIDKAGNSRLAYLPPTHQVLALLPYLFLTIFGIIIIALILWRFFLGKKK